MLSIHLYLSIPITISMMVLAYYIYHSTQKHILTIIPILIIPIFIYLLEAQIKDTIQTITETHISEIPSTNQTTHSPMIYVQYIEDLDDTNTKNCISTTTELMYRIRTDTLGKLNEACLIISLTGLNNEP